MKNYIFYLEGSEHEEDGYQVSVDNNMNIDQAYEKLITKLPELKGLKIIQKYEDNFEEQFTSKKR